MSEEKKEFSTVQDPFTLTTIGHLAKGSPIFPKDFEEKHTPNRRVSIIREFCLNTSTHGLPGIARSQTTVNRFFWCFSLASFTGMMLYLVTSAILSYLDYPTQMDIGIVSEWPQNFPAFSFCNIGGIRFDAFMKDFINFTNSKGYTNTNDTTKITADQALFFTYFVQDLLNRNLSMMPYYFPLSSMLYRCSYNGLTCKVDDFISFNIGLYGLCHTFNAKLKNSTKKIYSGNENGGNGILELGLYIHSHQYVPYLVDHIGVAAMVHDNTEVPLVDTYGLHLMPGQRYKLNYKKQASYFLSAPYTKCIDQPPISMDPVLVNYPYADYSYSQNLCYRYVIQIFTYQMCGCVNPSMWEIRYLLLPETTQVIFASLCDLNNTCYTKASNIYMDRRALQPVNASYECAQQCSDVEFLVEKSSSTTPMEWEMPFIKAFVENGSIPLHLNWSTNWKTIIQENYLSISLSRETNIVENRTQSATFSIGDVISNIGGQMGLWIGISLLSFMELLEMLFRLIHYESYTLYSAWQRRRQIQN